MQPDRNMKAFQGFLVEARRYWMSDIWSALKDDYARRTEGQAIATSGDVARVMRTSPLYCYYAWLERHIQRAKYAGRWGLVRYFRDEMPAGIGSDRLRLDTTLPIPEYFERVDIHQHPGNLTDGPGAGLVYKASAVSTQPGATQGYGLHERFATFLEELGRFDRILDMGCGFGKSALPIAERFAQAKVKGVDLAAPCLTLAAAEATQQDVPNLAYEQVDLRHTRYDDASFDLVTSTMVLHELDPPAVREALAETYRLLEPGGTAVHLDFRVKDPFLEFIHYGHGRRNNEPYMEPLNEMDVEAEMRAAGFVDVRTVPFEEAEGATARDWPTWRLPWTAFVARRPAASGSNESAR